MKKIIKNILFKLKGGYRPKIFWEEWGKTFFKDVYQRKIFSQHKWILEQIKELDPDSILEIGCGFGRNIKYLIKEGIPAEKITGTDISSTMLENCRQYIKNCKVDLFLAEAVKLPFKDKEFSFSFTHGVLMHIPPEKITPTIKEIFRITKGYFLCVEQNYNGNEYTFVHNYPRLFGDLGGKIIKRKKDRKGLDLFLVKL